MGEGTQQPVAVNAAVDDEMRDMDALRADLASETLRQGAHAGLGASKSTEQRLSADRPRGAGKENGAGHARNPAPGGFAPGPEGGERCLEPTVLEMGTIQNENGNAEGDR